MLSGRIKGHIKSYEAVNNAQGETAWNTLEKSPLADLISKANNG